MPETVAKIVVCKDCNKIVREGFERCYFCNEEHKKKKILEEATKPKQTKSKKIKILRGSLEEIEEQYNKWGQEHNITAAQPQYFAIGTNPTKVLGTLTIYYD